MDGRTDGGGFFRNRMELQLSIGDGQWGAMYSGGPSIFVAPRRMEFGACATSFFKVVRVGWAAMDGGDAMAAEACCFVVRGSFWNSACVCRLNGGWWWWALDRDFYCFDSFWHLLHSLAASRALCLSLRTRNYIKQNGGSGEMPGNLARSGCSFLIKLV